MIIAAFLFVIGTWIGMRFRFAAILLFSAIVAIACLAVWIASSALHWFSALVLFAYLTAAQAGYLFGSYLAAVRADDD